MMMQRKILLLNLTLLVLNISEILAKPRLGLLRRARKKDAHKKLRYLSLGTSVTFGSGLEDRKRAYPFLLSPDVKNMGIPASDARYPAACVQTMIQDEIYDVITIEYDRRHYDHLQVLVQRLRQRFPDALIILTKIWNLADVIVRHREGKRTGIIEPIRSGLQSISRAFHKYSTEEAFKHAMKMPADIWFDELVGYKDPIVDKIAESNDALVYHWDFHGNVLDLLNSKFLLFLDYVHLNIRGHEVVADGIKKIIRREKPRRSDNVGPWDGDFCSNWYEKGQLDSNPLGHVAIESPYPIIKFEETKGKHAIELADEVSKLRIENPFDGYRNLYIIYMASCPNRLYPKSVVSIENIDINNTPPVEIDPMAKFNYPVHVQESQFVGSLKPGVNSLIFKRLSKAEFPLRIVGFAMTNVDFSPTLMAFWPGKEEQ